MSHFGPFEVGQVKAHLHHGLGASAIARLVLKPDGTQFSDTAVGNTIAKISADSAWRGGRQAGSGRPRKTPVKLDKAISREVFKNRGKEKITVAALRKKFPPLRGVSKSLVEERLHDAGLAYMRRRRKTMVPQKYVQDRLAFAAYVLRRRDATLKEWAYSDGTVFYLDRTAEENEQSQRKALGSHVWRRADRADAVYADCVGPSGYGKAQGTPVRVWGLLAKGALHIHVLPEGQSMNRWWYAWLIEGHFPQWLGSCKYIVQDFERCLRCVEPLQALQNVGAQVVEEYPKCSQDLNAIENAWNLLRDRLYDTMPTEVEPRRDFIQRLRNAVGWVNRNKHTELWELSTNQKKRARDVLELKGSRTKW